MFHHAGSQRGGLLSVAWDFWGRKTDDGLLVVEKLSSMQHLDTLTDKSGREAWICVGVSDYTGEVRYLTKKEGGF